MYSPTTPSDLKSPNNPAARPSHIPVPWYLHEALAALLWIICMPAGVIIYWLNPNPRREAKVALTVVSAFAMTAAFWVLALAPTGVPTSQPVTPLFNSVPAAVDTYHDTLVSEVHAWRLELSRPAVGCGTDACNAALSTATYALEAKLAGMVPTPRYALAHTRLTTDLKVVAGDVRTGLTDLDATMIATDLSELGA